ncbi:Inner membrane protein YrbG [Pirellulimonas nuda]|uniref:Inner membrane protein YrbG n=1 Tax=Pirellulimonas nuda TaxID=2528009 RepID=A0A518D9S1_9BACT|nr:calcium/sodium antiporter [Pirellulimonas nuda]QDU88183.1 Inner membrane protein YrbG [Pirellulimonas nuda]
MYWIVWSIVGGFIGLIAGGELLVRGATRLALAAKISPLVVGLTVVAFGTSAPELAVSVQSCYAGQTDLAIGNAVGSNLANILLILGVSAIVTPLAVNVRLFKLDVPVMIATAVALYLVGRDGVISPLDGVGFTVALVAYFAWTLAVGRRESQLLAAELDELAPAQPGGAFMAGGLALLVVGIALLVYASGILVEGCTELARLAGVSELVIGLTVVAIGTSLPELATSIMAAVRGKRDLAVGNVVGSNILNILGVLGLSAIVSPGGIAVSAPSLAFDIPLMIAVSLVCMPIFSNGMAIHRWEGAVMLAFYAAFLAFCGWSAVYLHGAPAKPWMLAAFVVPLMVVTGISLIASKKRVDRQ